MSVKKQLTPIQAHAWAWICKQPRQVLFDVHSKRLWHEEPFYQSYEFSVGKRMIQALVKAGGISVSKKTPDEWVIRRRYGF